MSSPVVTLLTDFGTTDTYVGQMKGVLLGLVPEVVLVDLTHAVPPQQVAAGALCLADAVDAFPPGTIHVAVVDPGVGSERRGCAAEIGPYLFVGPDNGLFSVVAQRWEVKSVVELTNPACRRPSVATTFHGRDVFAPAAAHLALGRPLSELGPELTQGLRPLSAGLAKVRRQSHAVLGQIVWCDHFGNLISNITAADLPAGIPVADLRVECAGAVITGLTRFYASQAAGSLLALVGSSGRLELAVNQGSAERTLGVGSGTEIVVRWD